MVDGNRDEAPRRGAALLFAQGEGCRLDDARIDGELAVRSGHLASGYFRNAEATDEATPAPPNADDNAVVTPATARLAPTPIAAAVPSEVVG